MPRRVILPGADELFRSTGSVQRAPEVDDAESRGEASTSGAVATEAPSADAPRLVRATAPERPAAPRREDHRLRLAGGAGRPRARSARAARQPLAGDRPRPDRPRGARGRAGRSGGQGRAEHPGPPAAVPLDRRARARCCLHYVNLRRCSALSWASPSGCFLRVVATAPVHRRSARRSRRWHRAAVVDRPVRHGRGPAVRDRLVAATGADRIGKPRQVWTMVVVAVACARRARRGRARGLPRRRRAAGGAAVRLDASRSCTAHR